MAFSPGVKKEDDNADDDETTTIPPQLVSLSASSNSLSKDLLQRTRSSVTAVFIYSQRWSPTSRGHLPHSQSRPHGAHTRQRNPHSIQAAVALSKLCGSEDPSDVEEDEQAIDVLLDTLSCDPAAPTATPLNMPIAKHTLPCIVARSRDTDTVMRRLVYSAILENNCTTLDGSALHSRVLAISQRELIVRNGPGDREHAGSTKAEDALLSIFAMCVDILEQLELKDAFWDTSIPEKAFLGQASLPVVTGVYNTYQEDVDTASQERALRELDANERPGRDLDERLDDILLDAEFVRSEMLKLAVNLDYADEIGRRKMFQFVQDTIGQEGLPLKAKLANSQYGSPDIVQQMRELKLAGENVAKFFEPSVEAIVDTFEKQREAAAKLQIQIKHVFLVGGYAASDFLYRRLQLHPAFSEVQLCRPSSQVNKAVADGAVSSYVAPLVTSRASKYTYGVACIREYDQSLPDHRERYHTQFTILSGITVLPNAFKSILERGVQVLEQQEFRQSFVMECASPSELKVGRHHFCISWRSSGSPLDGRRTW
ncbi:hypothetical protein JVT61DRAFT_12317 [Boletus reticuloceps]|uniref:Uncharacterized protein n=1 Tax=Boletus reticuloceps TaxID=495285 RepID=A0A8I2YE32_9AGAM|nr:hypothetical protein JVT61DRAFT_12317 [Boletus reticuloceps]